MKKTKWYFLLVAGVITLDRITKQVALQFLGSGVHKVNALLSFNLVYNRGISWSLLNDPSWSKWLTVLIALVLVGLLFHTVIKYLNRQPIIGEVLVLAGGVSNLYDRFFYPGVIDFIEITFGGWSWPIFNIADMAIVLGVMIILVGTYHLDE